MVRYGDIPIAQLLCGFRKLLNPVPSVAPAAVNMEVPLDVFECYQRRKLTFLCGFHLPGILPQLRRDILKSKDSVNVLLIPATQFPAVLFSEDTVLVYLKPLPDRHLPYPDVVGLAAGEVL
ncbi:hypothetical protein BMS3Abin08_01220 [bacterium BMS3Abin08]|nr:hypothetical protein BMS3Abin08_01220 [bacterium BMS3Abin08]